MSRKALKVLAEIKLRAVSCPGVHLSVKDDVYLNMFFMDQFRQSLYETVRIELVQLIPPAGDILAFFEEDARSFLFPEPKLVPSFSGVDREVLMTRAAHFFSIAPRLEFSTKTTISECPPDTKILFLVEKSLISYFCLISSLLFPLETRPKVLGKILFLQLNIYLTSNVKPLHPFFVFCCGTCFLRDWSIYETLVRAIDKHLNASAVYVDYTLSLTECPVCPR
uniref:Spermatogenesis-associated protein 6 N-terminal domain-containing protein n=1 Tax=Poecilia latipinna TaxID=48699 RepID=A0A3B3TNW5_9TELE